MLDAPLRRREQEVWQALDDLWSIHGDFKYLTGDTIRERLFALGKSRGSPNEIYKYRKTWAESRKVASINQSSNFVHDDPITRAARLVHEELTQKAKEEIEHIKADFIQKEEDYKKEVFNIKTNLNSLVLEFSNLEKNYTQVKSEFSKENEARNALEIEIKNHKQRFTDLIEEKEKNIFELKSLFSFQLKELKDIFEKNLVEKNLQINKLEEEKKNLGAEYSEGLNQIKTENYNFKIIIAKQEDKILSLTNEITISKNNAENINKIIIEKEKNIAEEKAKKEVLQQEILDCKIALKKERFLVKSSETKLARLRALNLCYE